jgi:hypothetical protein
MVCLNFAFYPNKYAECAVPETYLNSNIYQNGIITNIYAGFWKLSHRFGSHGLEVKT